MTRFFYLTGDGFILQGLFYLTGMVLFCTDGFV